MQGKCKPSFFFFCFHPKFDTGTWSIAAAFGCFVVFSAIFVLNLSYSFPKCLCPTIWEHLAILPTAYKILYVFTLIYFLVLVVSSVLVIYGTFKAQYKKLRPFIIIMVFTEIGTFCASIYIFVFLAKIDQYLLFDNDTYWNMAKMVLKEDLILSLETIIDATSALLKTSLGIDMSESLNLDVLMDATLKDGVLIVMGGMKRMMKISAILLLIGINTFFVATIMVVAAHYKGLKKGNLRTYTGVPGLVIRKAVLTASARSTASDSFSDDWSGTPMKKMKRIRSKDYNSSTHSSKRIYNTDKLDVEEKFPKGDFL